MILKNVKLFLSVQVADVSLLGKATAMGASTTSSPAVPGFVDIKSCLYTKTANHRNERNGKS